MMASLLQFPAITVDTAAIGQSAGISYAFAGMVWLAIILTVFFVVRGGARKRYRDAIAFGRVVLQITVPKETAEKGESGQQEKSLAEIQEDIAVIEGVFSSIGGLRAERGLKAWFLGRKDSVSFEIVAEKGLVTFYAVVAGNLRDFIEQQVLSQYPTAQIEQVADYNIFSPTGAVVGAELKYRRPQFFPLKTFRKLESDPLNALTNALSKVDAADGAAIQLIVRSAKKEWRRPALSFVRSVQSGKSVKEALGGKNIAGQVAAAVGGGKKEEKKDYRLSPLEEEMVKAIDEKASKFGLDVNVRIITSSKNIERAQMYLDNIVGAFSQYNILQFGNEISKAGTAMRRVIVDFIYRHFDVKNRMVMTADELASMYHLPLPSTETPNIRWLLSRRAPPPPNIPKEGLRLGYVDYRGLRTDINIKREDRFRHVYIIGKSGSGKSKAMENMAVQDIQKGYGVAFVDPHGDSIDAIISCIPRERAEDVILFDPSDIERPMGLNMLEAPTEEMKDYVVGEMIAIFYKLFPPEVIGPMFEHNMRNFMLTLMADPANPGTIAEIPRLIADAAFQKQWVAKVKDPVVRSFWENEIAKTSDFHKSEMLGYLISKVGRFVENGMMRNIIGQQQSSFDFRKVMDEGKILLVKLSKGKIGDINANLIGLIIVTKLQMAALGRADTAEKDRKDFFLYIDEFQNFLTPSIATILSEARKYRLSMTVGHQYMAQLAPKGDTEIRDAVLGNVGTLMVGRIGIDDAQILEKEFLPVFQSYDLMNVDQFTFNTKLLIDNTASRPFTMKPPPPVKGNKKVADALRQLSRLKYGRDRAIVEYEILERTQLGKGGGATSQVSEKGSV